MKKIFLSIAILLVQHCVTISQTLSPQVLATAGGYFTGGGNSLSWTLGETFTTTLQGGGVILTQGQQQPYVELTILNLKMYLGAFYTGAGLMDNSGSGGCLYLTNVSPDPLDVDSVIISAMAADAPHTLVDAQVGILKTNGDVTVKFGSAVHSNTSYYIKIKHRNSIETWSKTPVLFLNTTTYSFTSAASQAYGDNEMATGDNLYYAIYSGDVNQDGAIDGSDFLDLDNAIQNGDGGYAIGDMNGDGAVDGNDFLAMDVNIQAGVGAAVP